MSYVNTLKMTRMRKNREYHGTFFPVENSKLREWGQINRTSLRDTDFHRFKYEKNTQGNRGQIGTDDLGNMRKIF
jgi:hypothetical protein